MPGQCCEEWVCDESKDALEELEGFFSKEFGLDASEGELTRNNELIAIVKGGLKMLPGECVLIRVQKLRGEGSCVTLQIDGKKLREKAEVV